MQRANVTNTFRRRNRQLVAFFLFTLLLLGLVSPAIAGLMNINVRLDDKLFGHLSQNKVPDCGAVACGPVAVVNALAFLQNKYPHKYDKKLIPDSNNNEMIDEGDLIEVAKALIELMECCDRKGTRTENIEPGIRKYIEGDPKANRAGKALGVTVYKSKFDPNWPFLLTELQAEQAVVLLIALLDAAGTRLFGHAVTMTGFTWTDIDGNKIINLKEKAFLHIIDPVDGKNNRIQIFQIGDLLQTDFMSGAMLGNDVVNGGKIELAISLSPVSEPTSIILFAIGLLGLLRNGLVNP